MPRNHQIWPEFGISDHCWLIRCPVDGLAGGCGARAVSRKTPIYFIVLILSILLIVCPLFISEMSFVVGSIRKTCGMGINIRKDAPDNTRVRILLLLVLLTRNHRIFQGADHIFPGVWSSSKFRRIVAIGHHFLESRNKL